MTKKNLYLLIALTGILLAGIVTAVVLLYSDRGKNEKVQETGQFIEHHQLIEAVPSDAAIVFCMKDFGRACEYLCDTVAVFRELTSGKFDFLSENSFDDIDRAPAIISIHYSKDMPPLLVVKAPKEISDTTGAGFLTLKAAADTAGLFTKVDGSLLLISSSETIINSSIRHMSEGHSILEANGFMDISSKVAGSDIIFASNSYTDNILETYFSRKHRKTGSFFKELAGWTAFSITKHTPSELDLSGEILYGSDHAYYMNVLRHAGTSSVGVAEVVPAHADFIIDLPIGSIASYLKAYRNYLDAKTRLDKYEYTLSRQKKETGKSAEDWAKALDIKEVAVADIHFGDKLRQLVLIKPGNKQNADGVFDFSPCSGFVKTLFGDIFTGEDESSATIVKGWIVAGSADCVEAYSKMMGENLKERLSGNGLGDRIPQKGCGFWMYHSLTEDPNIIDATFSPMMAKGFRNVIKGVTFVPVTLSAMAKGDKMVLEMNLTRTNITKSKVPDSIISDRDTAIVVPSGPYKVMNSATGKENTFYQNSHLSLCLQDENGKDVWGIPFKHPVLGYVREVDFYNNGKLQYLFAADSKLYLIDRLGRFVGGFPIDLGKKIAVGPEVFDFAGDKAYNAMVLFKDNTVGLYDLKGKVAASWKGITAKETIKAIPELLEGKNGKYWVVRTSNQTMVYPFSGGDPLVKGEGNKMIRPDSRITINEKGSVSAKCYDGKDRTFKLDIEKR